MAFFVGLTGTKVSATIFSVGTIMFMCTVTEGIFMYLLRSSLLHLAVAVSS